jgi:cytochrome c oxidase subunit 4
MTDEGTMTDQGTDVEVIEPGRDVVPAGEAVPAEIDEIPGTAGVQHHPGPREYILIAVVLVILTALEVGASYLDGDINSNLLILLLGVMAAIKFFLVAAWYMHMKQDKPFFRRVFVIGMAGAAVVYGIALATFASSVLGA